MNHDARDKNFGSSNGSKRRTPGGDIPRDHSPETTPLGTSAVLYGSFPPPNSAGRNKLSSNHDSAQSITGQKTHPVKVSIRVVFLKLGEIDTVKECFTADAFVQAKWRESQLDGTESMKPVDIKWENYWNPRLYIDNSMGDPKEKLWRMVEYGKGGEAYVCERRRVKGVFLETMELNQFPFDTQDITLTIVSELGADDIELAEDTNEPSSINVQSFADEQEWKLYNNIETYRNIVDKVFEGSRGKHPCIGFRCRASRRIGFYVWNIFFVMCVICTMAFTTFSVGQPLPQNRLQLTFILLLTTVTFKFAVMQILPRISYLTYLDYYIISSMSLYATICIWHSLIATVLAQHLYTPARIESADRHFLVVLGAIYIFGHIAFFLFVYFKVLKKRRFLQRREIEHKEKIRKQLRDGQTQSISLHEENK